MSPTREAARSRSRTRSLAAGPVDIVFVRGIAGDLLSTWDQPLLVRHVQGLADNGRLLMLDKRGTGLSDRVREVQSLDTAMDDIRAVMDAAGIGSRGALERGDEHRFGGPLRGDLPGPLCRPCPLRSADQGNPRRRLPVGRHTGGVAHSARRGPRRLGAREYLERLATEWAPEVAEDVAFRDWFVWHMRRSLSPGAALTSFRTAMDLDVSDVLAAVRVPTLVLPHPANPGPARFTADRIRNADVVDLPPLRGLYTWVDDDVHRATMAATARFVAHVTNVATPERVLATVLFTDIVGSTELAGQLGDVGWRDLVGRHHAIVRRELARYHGRELDTAGDGFFAVFDGPARAVQAAAAIRDQLHEHRDRRSSRLAHR